MSVIESMRAFHRCGGQTQPVFAPQLHVKRAGGMIRLNMSGGRLGTSWDVLQPQLIQQALEMGWQSGWFRSQVLPQPVPDSLADRRAGRTVDLHGSVGVSVGHYGFRFVCLV
jgi:hypothetical protein